MKKLFLLLPLLIFFFAANAQKWTPYKIDDSVQVSLPSDYKKTDTLGQTIISASSQFGNIIIVKSPDDPKRTPDIEKKNELEAFYQNYLQKINNSSKGTISDEKDTTINNLRYKDFTLEVDSGSGKQLRNFRIVHVNSATYTFEFLYQDIHKDYALEERDTFFNSIRIPPDTGIQNQFTQPENTTGTPPAGSNKGLIIGVIIAIIVIALIIFIIRRRKKHHSEH